MPWVGGDTPFVFDGSNALLDCLSDALHGLRSTGGVVTALVVALGCSAAARSYATRRSRAPSSNTNDMPYQPYCTYGVQVQRPLRA
jgi:hypothetical protein